MNSVYFDKEQEAEMLEFIANLNKQSYGKGKYKFEILIRPADCGAFIVEFIQVPWDGSFGGHFEHIDDDQVVMLEKTFPDNHYELCYDEDDYQERLTNWLAENPGWVKTSYGTWTNEIENEAMRKYFEGTNAKNDIEAANVPEDSIKDEDTHYENGIPQ